MPTVTTPDEVADRLASNARKPAWLLVTPKANKADLSTSEQALYNALAQKMDDCAAWITGATT